ncbi:Membrane-bound hydrogenase subunit alpha [uncultured archaeon]|nr:Membrane-bound hydrogenase subunit alpha [uncultured archaeon]
MDISEFTKLMQKRAPNADIAAAKKEGNAWWYHATPEELPELCLACAQSDGAFDSAFLVSSQKAPHEIAYAFRVKGISLPVVFSAKGEHFTSVSATLNAALWDERKIQDLTGIEFQGIADSRPLVNHPENRQDRFFERFRKNSQKIALGNARPYEMRGTGEPGEFEIPVGPVHAGIIEPGHFRFHVTGETINKMEVRMSYLHKGLERVAEGKTFAEALPLLEQASGDESVANAAAYAQAVEAMAGAKVPARAEALRLVLLELERIYSHLADLGGIATDIGFNAASSQFALLRENSMRLNERLTGNRFLRGIVAVGGTSRDISDWELDGAADDLTQFSTELAKLEAFTVSSSTFLDRVFLTGRVSKAAAIELGLVGPAARASGIVCDCRKHWAYGAYIGREVRESLGGSGEVMGRFNVKFNEINESVRLIKEQVDAMPSGAVSTKTASAKSGATGIGGCEAPRGLCTVLVKAGADGSIARLCIRTASFHNWRALEKAVQGNIVPDFPLINKSFNLSYSGTDL